ncbi:histidine-rich glycoprotein-like [Drosophila willistoni]|uniref:histidine-rich glycoprotein-like n=1 Tax=Drosophila willistoni TaxID=7260 RepID=UPI000C26C43A|nr:histidine-rich glycoprotein-like [Drosophila willistoni]
MGLTSALLTLGLIASGVYGNHTEPQEGYNNGLDHYSPRKHIDNASEEDHHASHNGNVGEEETYHHANQAKSDGLVHYKSGHNPGIHTENGSEEDNYHHTSHIGNVGEEETYHHANQAKSDGLVHYKSGHNPGIHTESVSEEEHYHHEENSRHENQAESFYKTEGKNYIFVTFPHYGYLNNNGHSLEVFNEKFRMVGEGFSYEIEPRAFNIQQNETLHFNGQQATIEYNRMDVIIEFPDKNVIAKMREYLFMGDREGFNHFKQLIKLPNRDIEVYLESNKHQNTKSGAIMQTGLTRHQALYIGIIHICITLYYSNVFTKVF